MKINVAVFWDMTPCSLIELPCIWGVPGSSIGQKVCIAVFTLDAGLLARSQYSEGPATGHPDTGFFLGFPVPKSKF